MNKYEKYKDSGIDWIGKIPEHWEVKPVKYISENYDGKRIPLNSLERAEKRGDFPYYGATGIVDYVNDFLFDGEFVLIGEDGAPFFIENRDVSFIASGKFWVNNHAHILKPKDTISSILLAHYLNCVDYRNYITGSTRDKLTQDQLNCIKLPLPTPEEQTAIANYLDRKTAEIDELIADKKRLLELYEEEKTAIINQAVTKGINPDVPMKDSGIEWLGEIPEHWEVKKFRFIFSLTKGLSITKSNLKDKGVPCVNYGEIHSKYGFEVIPERDELLCVDSEYIETSKKSLIKRGDFIFADTSEDIEGSGNFTHLHSNTGIFAGYHTIIARLKTYVNYRYIAFYIDSLSYRNQIRKEVKGVKVFSITNSILKDSFMVLPPLKEQTAIVQHIETEIARINAKIEKTKKLIDLLTEYRTALISEVVTGKIKVTE